MKINALPARHRVELGRTGGRDPSRGSPQQEKGVVAVEILEPDAANGTFLTSVGFDSCICQVNIPEKTYQEVEENGNFGRRLDEAARC